MNPALAIRGNIAICVVPQHLTNEVAYQINRHRVHKTFNFVHKLECNKYALLNESIRFSTAAARQQLNQNVASW
jgi:hypothetical protein